MENLGTEYGVATRLRRATATHDAYTVRVANRRVAALVTAHPADSRRWIYTTRWLHRHRLIRSRRLVLGLGVQWTPPHLHAHHHPPRPATLQLCAGHRCLVFHLARLPDHGGGAAAVPAALHRFLADPRVTFVGSGSAHDRRMLWDHYGIRVADGRELRALAGMGNASVEAMAGRFLGYPGIRKPRWVAVSDWDVPRLSGEQVEYACVDAYLAFRLGLVLCPGTGDDGSLPLPASRAPAPPVIHRAPASAPRAPALPRAPAPVQRAPPPAPRAPVLAPAARAPPPAPRAARAMYRNPPPLLPFARPPVPRAPVLPPTPSPAARVPTAVAVDAAESSTKIAETRAGSTGSDTDTDTEDGGLPVARSSYASDDDDLSSDEFELFGFGAATDEDEDVYDYLAGTGLLSDGDYVVGPGTPCDDDDEDVYEDYVGGGITIQEEVYKEYASIGILTVDDHNEEGYKEYTGMLTVGNDAACDDEVFVGNGAASVVVEEEGGLQLGGYQAPEYFVAGEAECYGEGAEAFDGGEDDGGDDWYDQGDDGYVQDDDSYDAFY